MMSRHDRHDGISCDVCSRSNFRGKRYKCLACNDYDLCAQCYENGGVSLVHLPTHPMQVILTRNDFDLYYGGEAVARERAQSFTCVACGRSGFTDASLYEHLRSAHSERPISGLNCPLCVAWRRGDPNRKPDDLMAHIAVEHRLGTTAEDRHVAAFVMPVTNRHARGASAAAAAGSFMRRRVGPPPVAAERDAQAERDALADLLAQLEGRVSGRAELVTLTQRMEQSIFEQLERRQQDAVQPRAVPMTVPTLQAAVANGRLAVAAAAQNTSTVPRPADAVESHFLLKSTGQSQSSPSSCYSQPLDAAQLVFSALYDSLAHEPTVDDLVCLPDAFDHLRVDNSCAANTTDCDVTAVTADERVAAAEEHQPVEDVHGSTEQDGRLPQDATDCSPVHLHVSSAVPVFEPGSPVSTHAPIKQRFVTKALRSAPRRSDREESNTASNENESRTDVEHDQANLVRPPFLD